MSKTVLVTGISGFIGLYCLKELLTKDIRLKEQLEILLNKMK